MQCSHQNKFVFFMILINYSSLISPSPSLSASSIISCNYSSAIVSPNYLATLFKFFNEIFPVLSSSKSLNAFRISSLGSLSLIFVVISSMKSANSITPFPSLSTSAISFFTSYFLGSKPRALMATFSSFESMYPKNEKMKYRQTQYRKGRRLPWFIVFVLRSVRFWPFWWVWVEPFLFWRWWTFELFVFKMNKFVI